MAARGFRSRRVELSSPINRHLAVLIAMVLLADHPLLGLPPTAVLDPVPRRDLAPAMTDGMDSLVADLEFDAGQVNR